MGWLVCAFVVLATICETSSGFASSQCASFARERWRWAPIVRSGQPHAEIIRHSARWITAAPKRLSACVLRSLFRRGARAALFAVSGRSATSSERRRRCQRDSGWPFFNILALARQFAPLPSKLGKLGAHWCVSGHCGHLVAISRTLEVVLYFGVHASASGDPNRAIETRTARRATGFRSRSELARTKSKTPRRRRGRRHRSGVQTHFWLVPEP